MFNYGSLAGVSADTVFKVTVTGQTATDTKVISVLMNTNSQSGVMPSGIAFALSIIILISGLSITTTQNTFGWFGIILCVISMAVLSLGVPIWYVTFLFAVELIVTVYIIIIMLNGGGQVMPN